MERRLKKNSKKKQIIDKIIETFLIIFIFLLILKHYRFIEYLLELRCINEQRDYLIGFCPGCKSEFLKVLNSSHTIKCALYSLDDEDTLKVLISKNSEIKVFYQNFWKVDKLIKELNKSLENSSLLPVYSKGLMHHKFCVIDNNYVLLGSLNPTKKGFQQVNDFIVIESKTFNKKLNTIYNQLSTNPRFQQNLLSSVFYKKIQLFDCKVEPCKKRLLYEIRNAKEKVWFAQFLITDNDIAQTLLEKSNKIDVKGIINQDNINLRGSDFRKLENFTKTLKDLHLKVWIIDNKIITGSVNPSANGFENNDELMIIISDPKVYDGYVKVFKKLYFAI